MRGDMAQNRVALVGAAGKMGRGIALTLLTKLGEPLLFVDKDFGDLKSYLKKALRRYAEKEINTLREEVRDRPDLVSNLQIIDHFIEEKLKNIHFSTSLESDVKWLFEAIDEDIEAKAKLFEGFEGLIFSNTSSIPIHRLQERTKGQVVGLHFYNPVPQKSIVELVVGPELEKKALEVCQLLGKEPIRSGDVAGFIGNGYFLRELALAEEMVAELSPEVGEKQARGLIDQVTKDLLLRPFGIYQLVDFIGIETVKKIGKVMNESLSESELLLPHLKTEREGNFHLEGGEDLQRLYLGETLADRLARRFLDHLLFVEKRLIETKVIRADELGEVLMKGFGHSYGTDLIRRTI